MMTSSSSTTSPSLSAPEETHQQGAEGFAAAAKNKNMPAAAAVAVAEAPPEEVGHEDPMPTIARIPPKDPPPLAPESTSTATAAPNNNNANNNAPTVTSVATLSMPWQFDNLQQQCKDCATQFTPLNRRHHCRLCGNIFCNACSNQGRLLIPPSSIVLVPRGGKKAKPRSAVDDAALASFSPDSDPDRMLTYTTTRSGNNNNNNNNNNSSELLHGKGLEERFQLAREPLRVCNQGCYHQLLPLQDELRRCNSNAVRFNHVDPTDARRLFNSPLAFTLGHEIRKASYTINNLLPLPKRRSGAVVSSSSSRDAFSAQHHQYDYQTDLQQCKETCSTVSPNLGNIDGVAIPARLLEQAKGVAVMTVCKGGFGLAGVEFGTGLVTARLDGGRWSAPSAIGCTGLSWGALIGAQVADHVFLLMTDKAVEMLFSDTGSVQLGADIGVALGPLGRSVEADFGAAPGTVAPIYTYSLSKGFYAGVSLDGKVIFTRDRVNEKFYGRRISGHEILQGVVPAPPAAQPLYEALTRCHVYATGSLPMRSGASGVSGVAAGVAAGGGGSVAAASPGRVVSAAHDTDAEYGETLNAPAALGDHHSYAGMSDITGDPGY